MRHVLFRSFIRSSWQFLPIEGIGLESGISNNSPFWSFLNRKPALILASAENAEFSPPHTSKLMAYRFLTYFNMSYLT